MEAGNEDTEGWGVTLPIYMEREGRSDAVYWGSKALTEMPIRAHKTREFPLLTNWLIDYITKGLIEY